MKTLFALVFAFSVSALAAPKPAAVSHEELVKTVLHRHVYLQGVNAKGALGADMFALQMGQTKVIAGLRLNDAAKVPSNGASSNPEMFHVNIAMTNSNGSTQTLSLKQVGKPRESVRANTRIVRYAAPLETKAAGRGQLVAIVGQSLTTDHVWTTKSAMVVFESK